LASSPAVDRSNPIDFAFAEPTPSGDRADQGAYGNTSQAAPSPSQVVQVTAPTGLEKLQTGQQVPITWRSAGLTLNRAVALVNAGGPTVDNWLSDASLTTRTAYNASQTVDASGIADA